jgi:Cys-tRNA(Pro)/Cys-tRNA(Cys) deacylase
MSDKTIAMKLLEGKQVPYRVYAYPDSERDAQIIAQLIGVPPARVFKTLVVVRDRGKPMLVMVPANKQLDLKGLAKAVGEKKLKMASHNEAEDLTGLEVGGISALALINKGFSIYLDKSAQDYDEILVSAGQRGLDVELAVADLTKLTRARIVEATA